MKSLVSRATGGTDHAKHFRAFKIMSLLRNLSTLSSIHHLCECLKRHLIGSKKSQNTAA